MIIKNGQLWLKPSIRKNTSKQTKLIIKGGRIWHTLGFSKIPTAVVTGYANKVLSIASTGVTKIIGVALTTIEKVIGAD